MPSIASTCSKNAVIACSTSAVRTPVVVVNTICATKPASSSLARDDSSSCTFFDSPPGISNSVWKLVPIAPEIMLMPTSSGSQIAKTIRRRRRKLQRARRASTGVLRSRT
jgi:hypothetical protein